MVAAHADAFQIDVTSTSGGTGGPGCTIRDAITAANMDAPIGGCPAGMGADTIVLAAPLYSLLQVDNVTDGPNGLPSIVSDITIEGNGAIIEHGNSAPSFRILHVDASGNLTLQDVTVRGGLGGDGAIGNPGAPGFPGGGIFNAGALDVEMSTVTGNAAGSGGNGLGSFDQGGAGGDGGGIYNTGSVTVVQSTVVDNRAGDGGRLSGIGGSGGGIANVGGDLRLINSTLSGNTAGIGGPEPAGGGIPTNEIGNGAGLYELGGSATVANSTIVNNSLF